jgi:hypothetical protein
VGEVVDQLAGLVVVEHGSNRDIEDGGLTGLAGAVGAESVSSALGFVLGIETKVDEGVVGK